MIILALVTDEGTCVFDHIADAVIFIKTSYSRYDTVIFFQHPHLLI